MTKLLVRIFAKLLEVIHTDKKDLEFFKKRIFVYSVTRILPSLHNFKSLIHENAMLMPNVVLLYNYFDSLYSDKLMTKELRANHFKDEMELVKERCDEIANALKDLACKEVANGRVIDQLNDAENLD